MIKAIMVVFEAINHYCIVLLLVENHLEEL